MFTMPAVEDVTDQQYEYLIRLAGIYDGTAFHTTWDRIGITLTRPVEEELQRRDEEACAETDFYTFIDLDGNPAGHLEQALHQVEGPAKEAIANIVHPASGSSRRHRMIATRSPCSWHSRWSEGNDDVARSSCTQRGCQVAGLRARGRHDDVDAGVDGDGQIGDHPRQRPVEVGVPLRYLESLDPHLTVSPAPAHAHGTCSVRTRPQVRQSIHAPQN
jgi:hypothetical protein